MSPRNFENEEAYAKIAAPFEGENFPAYDDRFDYVQMLDWASGGDYSEDPHKNFYENFVDYLCFVTPKSFEPYQPYLQWILKDLHNKGSLYTRRDGEESLLDTGVCRAIDSGNPDFLRYLSGVHNLSWDQNETIKILEDALNNIITAHPTNQAGSLGVLEVLFQLFFGSLEDLKYKTLPCEVQEKIMQVKGLSGGSKVLTTFFAEIGA